MFGLGLPELLLIVVVVLVLFGAGKLPKVMEDIGKGVASFRDSVSGKKEEDDSNTSDDTSKK